MYVSVSYINVQKVIHSLVQSSLYLQVVLSQYLQQSETLLIYPVSEHLWCEREREKLREREKERKQEREGWREGERMSE